MWSLLEKKRVGYHDFENPKKTYEYWFIVPEYQWVTCQELENNGKLFVCLFTICHNSKLFYYWWINKMFFLKVDSYIVVLKTDLTHTLQRAHVTNAITENKKGNMLSKSTGICKYYDQNDTTIRNNYSQHYLLYNVQNTPLAIFYLPEIHFYTLSYNII